MTEAELVKWLKSESAIRSVLMEVNVMVDGVETTRYLSNKGYVTGPTDTPANTIYSPAIVGGVKFTESLSLDGTPSLSYGDIELANTQGDRDSWLSDVWTNRAVKIFIGDVKWQRADFYMVFDGVVVGIDSRRRDRINLKLSDKMQRLNTPLSETKLGGTTTNKDKLLPLCFGECHNITPLLSNPALHEYQVHDGTVEDIFEVRDNGVPVLYTKDLVNGKFTLSQAPVGTITCSVQGAKPAEILSNEKLVNGEFSDDPLLPGWGSQYATINSGSQSGQLTGIDYLASVTGNSSVAGGRINQTFDTEAGRLYRVVVRMEAGTANAACYINYTTSNGLSGGVSGGSVSVGAGQATKSFTFTATGPKSTLILYTTTGVGNSAYFYSASVKEVAVTAGYKNTVANLVRHIAVAYGNAQERFNIADLDVASFNAFNTANPQPVGIYLGDRANVLDVCNNLAKSVGARLAMSRQGLLYLVKLSLPVASAGLTVTSSLMVNKSLSLNGMPTVKAGAQIGYCKNWTVQANLQTGLPEAHIAMFGEEWLTATVKDDVVAATYKLHTEPTMEETMLLDEADANAEAQRRLDMFKVQRKQLKYEGFGELMFQKLGDPQTIVHDRFNLSAGAAGQIIGLSTDWLNPHTEVEILI